MISNKCLYGFKINKKHAYLSLYLQINKEYIMTFLKKIYRYFQLSYIRNKEIYLIFNKIERHINVEWYIRFARKLS